MPQTWSTDGIAASERYAFWRETLTTAFTPLRPEPLDGPRWTDGTEIHGRVASDALEQLNVASITSHAQKNVHGPNEVRRSDEDVWFVNLILKGRCVGEQDGRECELNVASIGVFDARRPFQLTYTSEWEALSVRVPVRDVVWAGGRRESPTGKRIPADSGSGRMLATLMTSMAQWRPPATDAGRGALADAFLLLLDSAASANGGSLPSSAELDKHLQNRIVRHLRVAVDAGAVQPAEVARRFNISVRKLHQLFEGAELSFSRTVTAVRADRLAEELSAGSRATLTELSAKWGFADASHMHRVFRSRFGCSPADYRRRAPRP